MEPSVSEMSFILPPTDVAADFFRQVAVAIDGEKEDGTVFECFRPVFDWLKASAREDMSLSRSSNIFQCLDVLLFFAQHHLLAKVRPLIHSIMDKLI